MRSIRTIQQPTTINAIGAAAIAVLLTLPCKAADAAPPLGSFNADIKDSSISGISSGAFMAVQFGTIWSSIIKGVGVIAGGPYFCAEGMPTAIATGLNVLNALGPCMKGVPAPAAASAIHAASDAAADKDIDAVKNVANQKIYLFHGYNDTVVARPVTDAAEAFYRHYASDKNKGNIFYQTSVGAGHSQVTAKSGLACNKNEGDFIDNCGYDQAGILLQHIYGVLSPPSPGPLTGHVQVFDQSEFTKPDSPASFGLDETGYLYVPASCERMGRCRVHIALHGCQQYAGLIKQDYVLHAGYNEWADANNIIILYPQTTKTLVAPVNPNGCWDWWGYTDFRYATRSGPQIHALKAMLDRLTKGKKPEAQATQPPQSLTLIAADSSDTAIALAWSPIAGATAYEIDRAASSDQQFQPVGTTSGPSFADSGLTPDTRYAYRVKIMINGSESGTTPTVIRTTQKTPLACPAPGDCPVAAHN